MRSSIPLILSVAGALLLPLVASGSPSGKNAVIQKNPAEIRFGRDVRRDVLRELYARNPRFVNGVPAEVRAMLPQNPKGRDVVFKARSVAQPGTPLFDFVDVRLVTWHLKSAPKVRGAAKYLMDRPEVLKPGILPRAELKNFKALRPGEKLQ
jgi:hypothetical protein